MAAPSDVFTATFPLSVTTDGPGTITSVPQGIDCGVDCSEDFTEGTSVELLWSAPAGYALAEWSGYCWGRDSCRLTMDGPKWVAATFAETPFTPTATLNGVNDSDAAWGDYDGDGDLDVALMGWGEDGSFETILYRNDSGTFVDSGIQLGPTANGVVRWADYDRDGDLDLLVVGEGSTMLYRNDGSGFTAVPKPLPALVATPTAAWGDYDNDGDLDVVMAGRTDYDASTSVTKLFRNDGGTFVDSGAALTRVYDGDVAWGDYDKDGDLDLAVCGYSSEANTTTTRVYRNDAGVLADSGAQIAGVELGSLAWVDLDNDGDLDLVVGGFSVSDGGQVTKAYRNDNGTFVDTGAALAGISQGRLAAGDADSDGDADLLLTGYTGGGSLAALYRNDAGEFSEAFTGLPNVERGGAAWGDYDGDGRLDLVVHGDVRVDDWDGPKTAGVYRNLTTAANVAPQPPADLGTEWLGTGVRLSWSGATDTETPSPGLSYNVRVGTTPSGSEVVSPMADPATGFRQVVALGNAGENTSFRLNNLPPGRYYWAVQAIDSSFAGSSFSGTVSFIVGPVLSVAKQGTGSGLVTSVPAGIDCGAACQAAFAPGTVVTLAVTPDAASVFAGWSGACSGLGSCTLTMDGNQSAVAAFTRLPVVIATRSKSVATPPFVVGGPVNYTIRVSNGGSATQPDNPGHELVDVVPSELTELSASATSGIVTVDGNTVSWDGSIPGGGSITITIGAKVGPTVPVGTTIANQGTIHYDADADGTNESSVPTDDPSVDGSSDPTSLVVVSPSTGFYTLTPCRLVDTRGAAGAHGGPALAAGAERVFVLSGQCGFPSTARAVSLNLTVTQPTNAGIIRLYPAGTPRPTTSSINYAAGQTRANNAIVALNGVGEVVVYCGQASGTAHVVLDVNGYFE